MCMSEAHSIFVCYQVWFWPLPSPRLSPFRAPPSSALLHPRPRSSPATAAVGKPLPTPRPAPRTTSLPTPAPRTLRPTPSPVALSRGRGCRSTPTWFCGQIHHGVHLLRVELSFSVRWHCVRSSSVELCRAPGDFACARALCSSALYWWRTGILTELNGFSMPGCNGRYPASFYFFEFSFFFACHCST